MSMNLELRRDFTCLFVLAEVELPIIGWNWSHTMDSSSTEETNSCLPGTHRYPSQVSSRHYQFPVKSNRWRHCNRELPGGNLEADKASRKLSRGPENTTHHIRITPGPPVACHTRRLPQDSLAIAKAVFDTILRDGTARRAEGPWFRPPSRVEEGRRLVALWRLSSP